jgi:hypothetical protein
MDLRRIIDDGLSSRRDWLLGEAATLENYRQSQYGRNISGRYDPIYGKQEIRHPDGSSSLASPLSNTSPGVGVHVQFTRGGVDGLYDYRSTVPSITQGNDGTVLPSVLPLPTTPPVQPPVSNFWARYKIAIPYTPPVGGTSVEFEGPETYYSPPFHVQSYPGLTPFYFNDVVSNRYFTEDIPGTQLYNLETAMVVLRNGPGQLNTVVGSFDNRTDFPVPGGTWTDPIWAIYAYTGRGADSLASYSTLEYLPAPSGNYEIKYTFFYYPPPAQLPAPYVFDGITTNYMFFNPTEVVVTSFPFTWVSAGQVKGFPEINISGVGSNEYEVRMGSVSTLNFTGPTGGSIVLSKVDYLSFAPAMVQRSWQINYETRTLEDDLIETRQVTAGPVSAPSGATLNVQTTIEWFDGPEYPEEITIKVTSPITANIISSGQATVLDRFFPVQFTNDPPTEGWQCIITSVVAV